MSHGSQVDNLKSQFSDLTSDKLSFLDVDMLFFDDSWDFKLRSDMASRGRNESAGGWKYTDNGTEFVPLGLDDHYEVDLFGTDNVFDTVRHIDRKDNACLHLHGLAVLFCSWLKKNLADSFADGKLDQEVVDLFNSKDDFVQFLRVDNLSGINNDVNTDSDATGVKPKDVELTYTYRLNPKYLVDVLDKFANLSTASTDWKLSSYEETARKISVVQASKWLRSAFLDFLDRRLYDVSDAFLHYRASFQGGVTGESKSFAPGCFMQLRTPKNVDWVTWLIEQTSKYDMSQYDVSAFDGDKASEELPLGFEPEIFLTPAVVSEVSTTNFTEEELLEVHITAPGGYSYSSVATALFSASSPKTYVLNKEDNTNKFYIIDGVEGFSKASPSLHNTAAQHDGLVTPSISTVYINGNRVDFANSHQDTYITEKGYSYTVSDIKTALPDFLRPRGYSKVLSSFSEKFINKITLQSVKESTTVKLQLPSDNLYLNREGYLTPLTDSGNTATRDSAYYRPGPALSDAMLVETLMPLPVEGTQSAGSEDAMDAMATVLKDAIDLGVAKQLDDGTSPYYSKARVYFPSMYIKKPIQITGSTDLLIPDSVVKPSAGEVDSDFSRNGLEDKDRWPDFWPMCIPLLFHENLMDPITDTNQPVICTIERDTDKAELKIKRAGAYGFSQPYGTPVMARIPIKGESVGLLSTYEGTFSIFSGDVPFTVVESVGAPIVSGYKSDFRYIDIYALHSGINLTIGLGGASQQIFNSLLSKDRNISTDNVAGNLCPASIPVTALSIANKTDTPKLNPMPYVFVENSTGHTYYYQGETLATYPIAARSQGYYLNRGEKIRIYFKGDFPKNGVMSYLLIGLDGGKPIAAVPLILTDSYATQGFNNDTSGILSGDLSYLKPDGVVDWATEDVSRGYPALKDNEIGFYRRGKILDAFIKKLETDPNKADFYSSTYPHSRVFAREVVRV